MKKKGLIALLFFMILIFPVTVFAKDSTKRMYISMDVLEDGSIAVVEVAELSGEYNGRLRSLVYQNTSLKQFTGEFDDFKGSSIYNGSGITDLKVCDTSLDFDENNLGSCEKEYRKVNYASEGMSGVYEETTKLNGVDLKIYNPSSRNRAFYLSYTIRDVVVVHNDVAEIAWNILGDSYLEDIDDLKVWVNLPQKDSDFRVFLKGSEKTLNGEVTRKNDQTAYIYYNFLGAYNPITVRMIFDKSMVPYATKFSGVEGKENILKVERDAAEEANKIRNRIKQQNAIIIGITLIWLFIGILVTLYFLHCKKKNKQVDFYQDYYRDFPGDYGPEILEYLLKTNVSDKGMSASLLNIIDKKVLKIEDNPNAKKDYYLVLVDEGMKGLTENEKLLCHLFIHEIGDGSRVSLKMIKHYGNNSSRAKFMIDQYTFWKVKAKKEGKMQGFFTGVHKSQIMLSIVGAFSFLVLYLNIVFETGFILGYLAVVLGIFQFLYAMNYSFKTEKGALEYAKWQAFKRFLKDFGLMNEKELPEVKLWGKYLVYATVLGCAETLEKEMRIKLDSMNIDENSNLYLDYYYTNRLMRASLYSTISSSVTTAVSSSRSSIAASSSSSSSGFGGGSSFGGGSFGGGGGGGRF